MNKKIQQQRLVRPLLTATVALLFSSFLHLPALAQAVAPQPIARIASPLPSYYKINYKIETKTDIEYGNIGGTSLTLDAYLPTDNSKKHPAVLLIHGGAWAVGDKKSYTVLGQALAQRGYVAFSINYRLVTKTANKYPAQLDDAQRAVRWIRAHADNYNVDPSRIGAFGDSAGAYLAASLGVRDTRDNSDGALANQSSRVQCVVDFYGPADFTVSPETAAKKNGIAVAIVTNFLGKTVAEDPALYKESSPITYVDEKSAPFLIMHGTTDWLVPLEQSENLYNALRKAGVNATLLEGYKLNHDFMKPSETSIYTSAAFDFLDRVLKP